MKHAFSPDDPLYALSERLKPLRQALLEHPVYQALRTMSDLQIFLEHHVFAVWDFMSLLKALQLRLTTCTVPWVPAGNSQAARLINEIVLGEESDEDGRGGHLSHFELYLRAMEEAGAKAHRVHGVIGAVREGKAVRDLVTSSAMPQAVRKFLTTTFDIIESGSLPAIAAAFTLGREDLIPDMFRKIVEDLSAQLPNQLGVLRYYLDRHIGLDDEEHGPMAFELLRTLCGRSEENWRLAAESAEKALRARLALWDGIAAAIRAQA